MEPIHSNFFVRVWRRSGANHDSAFAAAISYFVLFSIVPLISFLIAIFGYLDRDPQKQQDVANRVLQSLPLGTSQTLVLDAIRSASTQSGTLTVLGLIGLLWSASGMFGAIREALNVAWGVRSTRGFIAGKLMDLGSVFGLGLLVLISTAATIALHVVTTAGPMSGHFALGTGPLVRIIGYAVPALISFITFLLLFRYIPNVHHTVGDVWIGALVAAVLFELTKHVFAWYVAHFTNYQALYGALGAVMLFMVWTYFAAYVMLIGAEVAAEHERMRYGPTPEPAPADRSRTAWGAA